MQPSDPNEKVSTNGGTHPSPGEHSSAGTKEFFESARKTVQQQTLEGADRGRAKASQTASRSAEALDQTARNFQEQGQESLAQTTSSLANTLSRFANRLEYTSADELMQDGLRLARRNPGLFIAGSVGAGFLLSRFFKASPPRDQ